MSTRVAFDSRLGDIDPVPDQPFRAAFGCYVGAIAAAFGVSVLISLGLNHSAVVIFASMALFLVGLVGGMVAVRWWTHGPERTGDSSSRFLFLVPPVGMMLLGLVWPGARSGILLTNFFAGVLALLVGAGLAAMARNRYAAVWSTGETPAVSWEAPKPDSVQHRRLLVANAVALPPLLALYVSTGDAFSLFSFGQTLGVVNIVVFSSNNPELAVYEGGLVADSKFAKSIYHWQSLDGYRLTDEELHIGRSWWPDMHFDREEIEDVDAVVAALDDHLSELPADHNVFSRWFPTP